MKYVFIAIILAVAFPFFGFWIVAIVTAFGVLLAAYAVISPFWGGEEWRVRNIFGSFIPSSYL
jgi:hypothetical protein